MSFQSASEYIDMCLARQLITLDVKKDIGKATDIYKNNVFSDNVRVIEISEHSFEVCQELDGSIPASPNTIYSILPKYTILITSQEELSQGLNVFRIIKVKFNPKRRYFLFYAYKYHRKRRLSPEEGEINLDEEVKMLRKELIETKNEVALLREQVNYLITK